MRLAIVLHSACVLAIATSSAEEPTVSIGAIRAHIGHRPGKSFADTLRSSCRRFLTGELSAKDEPLDADEEKICSKHHGVELANQATLVKSLTRNVHPDIYETGISVLEMLHRLAICAIKPDAPDHIVAWMNLWQQWWETDHPKLEYDSRSAADRFYAYIMERQLGFIETTIETVNIEELLHIKIIEMRQALLNS